MEFKKLYLLLLCLFAYGCSSEVPVDQLTYKNGLKVLKDSGELFTGLAVRFEGGETPSDIIEYKEGKLDGNIKIWYTNGELKDDFNARLNNDFYEYAQGFSSSDRNMRRLDHKALESFLIRYGEEYKWYDTGEMKSEGQYSEDGSRKVGYWQEWYENGILKKEGEYSSDLGIAIGEWNKWYENGKLFEEAVFDDEGQFTGTIKVYCLNGTLGSEMQARGAISNMAMKFWDCNGKELSRVSIVNSKPQGATVLFKTRQSIGSGFLYENALAMIEAGRYEVSAEDYYKAMESEFDNGKPSGLATAWNEKGEIEFIKDFNAANFINSEYIKLFLSKGSFGPYYKNAKSTNKWRSSNYNFIKAKPDVEATQLYLQRQLVDPAKKIPLSNSLRLASIKKDAGIGEWTYPIIVASEGMFNVIKTYPGVSLDSVNTKGQNRLHLCIWLMLGNKPGRCSFEHFQYLVKNIPINEEDYDGMTAINYVTESFHKKGSVSSRRREGTDENAINALQLLVKEGANINHKDDNGQTVLMRALTHKEYSIAKAILDLDADVNVNDAEGHNAIHFVFFERTKSKWHKDKYNFKLNESRKKILTLLAQNSVKINLENLKGKTVTDIALIKDKIKTAQFLESLLEVKVIAKNQDTVVAITPEIIKKDVPRDKSTELKVGNKELPLSSVQSVVVADSVNLTTNSELGETASLDASIVEEDRESLLYQLALSQIKRSRLSRPKGDSALDSLKELSDLTSDSDSRVAELRQKIADKYLSLARGRINDYRYQDALRFIKTSQKIQPSNTATQLRKTVNQKMFEEISYQQKQNSLNKIQQKDSRSENKETGVSEFFKSIFD